MSYKNTIKENTKLKIRLRHKSN